MLLRFGFSNYRSIKDYQELSLAASSITDTAAEPIEVSSLSERILPAIAIYGANAAGKSNVLRAFQFMRRGILSSHSRIPAEEGIPRTAFRLSKPDSDPSQFDCDVLIDDIRYHYGYIVDDERVREEWLYAYPHKQRQVWFHRDCTTDPEFFFGKSLKGQNRVIANLTRSNSLFLSAAAQNNHGQLSSIYKFFKDNFVFKVDSGVLPAMLLAKQLTPFLGDQNMKEKIVSFLQAADTGIVDIELEKVTTPDDQQSFFTEMTSIIEKHAGVKLDDSVLEVHTAKLAHAAPDGGRVLLDLDDESNGTLCLLSMLGPALDALSTGKTLVFDELSTNMHPLLSKRIIKLFSSRKTNIAGAQLIFTTHDTNLLAADVLRRDQIWFAEKDNGGCTHIYPLTDIRTRKTDNIERGYLQGRYGAIPYLGNLSQAMACQD